MKNVISLFVALTISGTTFAGDIKTISLEELLGKVGQKIGVSGISDEINARMRDDIAVQSRVFGDTGLEFESEFNNSRTAETYAMMVNQPIRLGGSGIERTLELEAKASQVSMNLLIRSVSQQVAESIFELTRMQGRQIELNAILSFYTELSQRLKSGVLTGQSSSLASQQVSEALRQTQEEIKINSVTIKDLQENLNIWGFEADTVFALQIPSFKTEIPDTALAALPEVARLNAEAAAYAARAASERGQYDFSLGVGAQKNRSDGETSYLVKLETPLGQIFSNRQRANVHLRDQALSEAKARIETLVARQKLMDLVSQLKKANTEKDSLIARGNNTTGIFKIAKSGFERGALSFIELRDGFDQMVDAKLALIDLTKNIQSLQLEIFVFTGGAQ